MCGPELMRILIDEKKLEWDDAWNIVTQVVSYTNHTILPEALEKWPISTFSTLLPRVYQIIDEIEPSLARVVRHHAGGLAEASAPDRHSVGWRGPYGQPVRNLQPLRQRRRKDPLRHPQEHRAQGLLCPDEKFNNKTNGISHRRFFAEASPTYAKLVTEAIGDGWLRTP